MKKKKKNHSIISRGRKVERTVWVWGRAVDRQPQDLQFHESKTQETDGEPYVIFRLQANQAGQNCSPMLHRQTTWSWMQPGNGGASSPWEINSQMVKVGSGPEQSMPYPISSPQTRETLPVRGRGSGGGPPTDPRQSNGECAWRHLRCVHTVI